MKDLPGKNPASAEAAADRQKKSIGIPSTNLENLKKNRKSKKEKKHGGARSGAGRKPKIDNENVRKMKELIEGHGLEQEDINGKKLERVIILLTVLFREGAKGNIAAIKEYLDRQLGKAKESVELKNGDGGSFSIKISTLDKKQNGHQLDSNKKTKRSMEVPG